jgi:hypothetical protein
MRSAAKHLQAWGQRSVGNVKIKIAIANILIFIFDQEQDRRRLSGDELWLQRTLKQMVLSLSSLERMIER